MTPPQKKPWLARLVRSLRWTLPRHRSDSGSPKGKGAETEAFRTKAYWKLEGDRWVRLSPWTVQHPRGRTFTKTEQNGSMRLAWTSGSWSDSNTIPSWLATTTTFWVRSLGPWVVPSDACPFPRIRLFRKAPR